MTPMLIALAAVGVLELMLWWTPLWRIRKPVSSLIIIATALLSGAVLVIRPAVWSGLVLFFSAYRLVNLLRLIEGRTPAEYLRPVARLSSTWLLALQIVCVLLSFTGDWPWLGLLAAAQLAGSLVLLRTVIRNLRTTRPLKTPQTVADRDLPTLTVAIPARNETDDLEACLRSLTASDYPKLEILVLDDCSQNPRTPEIIRSFAHDGVRFIAGEAPPEQWLAKNYAYFQLAQQANGDLLCFCGVDTRFEPQTLRQLVTGMQAKRKTMLSVLPRNLRPRGNPLSLMVQPSRYAWELALPRRWLQRPPVLSTCWLISRQVLKHAGGLSAVRRTTNIESYFARFTARHEDGYSFVCSDQSVGLKSAKNYHEQLQTAIRTRYPQLHRRPELAGLVALAQALVLIGPYAWAIIGLTVDNTALTVAGLLAVAMNTATYALIVRLAYRSFVSRSLWLLPFAALYDICLLQYSMWQYEFGEIIWKGRNVCVPVMQVIPHLPDSGV